MGDRYRLLFRPGGTVTFVESSCKAAAASIRVGDNIKELNQQPIDFAGDYAEIVHKIKSGGAVNLSL